MPKTSLATESPPAGTDGARGCRVVGMPADVLLKMPLAVVGTVTQVFCLRCLLLLLVL